MLNRRLAAVRVTVIMAIGWHQRRWYGRLEEGDRNDAAHAPTSYTSCVAAVGMR